VKHLTYDKLHPKFVSASLQGILGESKDIYSIARKKAKCLLLRMVSFGEIISLKRS
jgi:hypothetical protein